MSLKLASGSYDNTIRFWDPSFNTSNSSQTIKLETAPISIQINETKQKIAVGTYNSAKVIDISKPTTPSRIFQANFKGNVNAVGCFKKEDKLIYTACEDGNLRIFDLRSKKLVKEYNNNTSINCAVLHPNQASIIFGDQQGTVVKWDLYKQNKTSIWSSSSIRAIAMSDNLERVASGNNEGFINCYSQKMTKKNMNPIPAHDDYILKMKISPNNRYLASCSADKKIKLWKVNVEGDNFILTQHKTLKGHLKWVWDCQFSCDQNYLITCSTDTTIKIWDVDRGELVQTLKGHQKGVICLSMNDMQQA